MERSRMLRYLDFIKMSMLQEELLRLIGNYKWKKSSEDELIEVFKSNAKDLLELGKSLGF